MYNAGGVALQVSNCTVHNLFNTLQCEQVCSVPSQVALQVSVTGDTATTNALLGASPLPPFLHVDRDDDDEDKDNNNAGDFDDKFTLTLPKNTEMTMIFALNMFHLE